MILFCDCKNNSMFRPVKTFHFENETYAECENDTFFFTTHERKGKSFIEIHCEECGKNVAIPTSKE